MHQEWELVILHLVSDAIIAFAYIMIPALLVTIRQNRPTIPFGRVMLSFVLFILFCGMTHISNIVMLWNAYYWFDGLIKVATAVVSFWSLYLLFKHRKDIVDFGTHLAGAGSLNEINKKLDNLLEEI